MRRECQLPLSEIGKIVNVHKQNVKLIKENVNILDKTKL